MSSKRPRGDHDHLDVVGPVTGDPAAVVARIVIVVGDDETRTVEDLDTLDRLQWEREGVSDAELSSARGQRYAVRVANAQQIGDEPLLEVTRRVHTSKIDEVDLLLTRLRSLGRISFDQDESIRIHGSEVGDHGVRKPDVDTVLPCASCIDPTAQVELVQDPTARITIAAERAFQHRVQPVAIDTARHRLESEALR